MSLSRGIRMACSLVGFGAAVALGPLVTPRAAVAQVPYEVLHSFTGVGGVQPAQPLCQADDGNFYGTTAEGGVWGAGVVFRMTPSGVVTELASFGGSTGDDTPSGPLMQADDGNLYGTTSWGGASHRGTAFRLTKAGVLTILHSFTGADGSGPRGALVQATDGNFYGVTRDGGDNNVGTIYRMTPAGIVTVLHSFSRADGSLPLGLVQGADGSLYGVTREGGSSGPGRGTAFRITTSGAFTFLRSFMGDHDGQVPSSALIQSADGNLYGTTERGGAADRGTVYRMTPAGVVTVLYSFAGGPTDGQSPLQVLQAANGDFYGTTADGGALSGGTVYRITSGGVETVLRSFARSSQYGAAQPRLMQGADGDFYGTTGSGGAYNFGTAFRLTPSGALTTLHDFDAGADGAEPGAALIQAADGSLYGTTARGGPGDRGTVFRMTAAGALTVLHAFVDDVDGRNPSALVQAADGDFYGTQPGGPYMTGTFFRMTPAGSTTVRYAFHGGADGQSPTSLIQARDGSFYGTTLYGGTYRVGTIFRMLPGGAITPLYAYPHPEAHAPVTDPVEPQPLFESADGTFYGTTAQGGASHGEFTGRGTIVQMTPAGTVTELYRFVGGPFDGEEPSGGLVQGGDGSLYGTTRVGGASGLGTIFRMTPAGVVTILHAFAGGAGDGAKPLAGLVRAADGTFYGTASEGGPANQGVVFRLTPLGTVTIVHAFSGGALGSTPNRLLHATDGNLYGTAKSGGTGNGGVVFRLNLAAVAERPTVVVQPQSQITVVGAAAVFVAAASGTPWPTVQWQVSADGGAEWTPVAGATSMTVTLTPAAEGTQQVRAVFTNGAGAATTTAATLTVRPPRVLTVTMARADAGLVTSAPAGLSCGATCDEVFAEGVAVTLTATATPGWIFAGWSGAGCTGTDACVVTMTTDRQVAARFVVVRYLAEGATSSFFDTRLALLNPGPTATTATVTFTPSGASPVSTQVVVPGRTRVTLDPKAVAGLARAEFATMVEADQLLIVDRTMSWDVASGYGAHAETAVAAPALTWYLAEGSTVGRFDLFYLLQNPNPSDAQVRVRYLRPSGAPLEKTYTVPPNSRTNIWVNQEDFSGLGKALAATDVSAVVEVVSGPAIIVERAMYLDLPGQPFGAGHASAGVTAPATQWYLAEGATGAFFDLFVLVANPGASAALVEATYLRPEGAPVVKAYVVGPNSRFNIWVDREDAQLADTAVSVSLRADRPVVVERAMWWPGSAWYEAHNSPGATTTGTQWALADGEVGGPRGVETYILLANTSPTIGTVKVTLLFEDGASAEKTFTVPGSSRFNVAVASEFAQAAGKRFGALVESQGTPPAEIVVERAMYWDAGGQPWAAGTSALATKLP